MELYKALDGSGTVLKTSSRLLMSGTGSVKAEVVMYTDNEGQDFAMKFDAFCRNYELEWEIPSPGSLYLSVSGTLCKITEVDIQHATIGDVSYRSYPTLKERTLSSEDFRKSFKPFKITLGQAWSRDARLFRVDRIVHGDIFLSHNSFPDGVRTNSEDLLHHYQYLIE